MGDFELFVFAWVVGFTFAGLSASLAEAVTARSARFRQPFVSGPPRMLQSLALTATAGPAMLLNELNAARRLGAVGLPMVLLGLFVVNGWALASGILVVEALAAVFRAFIW